MLHLDQMFPKKRLDAEDFAAAYPQGAIVTIERIDFETAPSRSIGQPECLYYLYVREFLKPVKLNTFNAYAIADVLGTKFPNEWTGRCIRLTAGKKMGTDQMTGRPRPYWAFDVDMLAPATASSFPAKQDISGFAAQSRVLPGSPGHTAALPSGAVAAMGELAPIGADKAGDVAVALSERARTLADFTAHLGNIGLGGLVHGKPPPAWPQAVLPVARKFCAQLPKSAAPMAPSAVNALKAQWVAAPTEVVNTQTGEVITPAPATQAGSMRLAGEGQLPPQKPQTAAASQEFNEEDIPF